MSWSLFSLGLSSLKLSNKSTWRSGSAPLQWQTQRSSLQNGTRWCPKIRNSSTSLERSTPFRLLITAQIQERQSGLCPDRGPQLWAIWSVCCHLECELVSTTLILWRRHLTPDSRQVEWEGTSLVVDRDPLQEWNQTRVGLQTGLAHGRSTLLSHQNLSLHSNVKRKYIFHF